MEARNERGPAIKKNQIGVLISEYDSKKTSWRALTGDTAGMRDLRKFFNDDLKDKAPSDDLDEKNIATLIELLNARFFRLSRHAIAHDYRSQEKNHAAKFTNDVYRALAKLVANHLNDPKILAAVQYFKNDYSRYGLALFKEKPEDQIFVTSQNYAILYSELVQQIKEGKLHFFKVYNEKGVETGIVSFTDEDVAALKQIPQIRNHPSVKELFDLHDLRFPRPQPGQS